MGSGEMDGFGHTPFQGPGGFAPPGDFPPQPGAYPPQTGAYPLQPGAHPQQPGGYPHHGVPGRNGGHDGQWDGWYDGWEEGQESRKESKEGCKVWATSGCPGSWGLYGFQEFQGREIGFQLQFQLQFI